MESCILEGKVGGKRRRGRQREAWASDVVKFVEVRGSLVRQAVC